LRICPTDPHLRRPYLTGVRRLATLCGCLTLLSCAHRAGSQAAEGAIKEIAEQAKSQAVPGERPVETMAGAATDGVLRHLGSPEQLATIERVITVAAGRAADEARERLVKGLLEDLGPDGEGDLGRILVATAGKAATRVADGMMARVVPDCQPGDTECFDRRVEELSLRAGNGFMHGLKAPLDVAVVMLSFMCGAVVATLVGWLLRRPPRPTDTGLHPVDASQLGVLR
jgi:hypothetical protein